MRRPIRTLPLPAIQPSSGWPPPGAEHGSLCNLPLQGQRRLADCSRAGCSVDRGYEFALPVGKIYSKNITPDPETGIGRYPMLKSPGCSGTASSQWKRRLRLHALPQYVRRRPQGHYFLPAFAKTVFNQVPCQPAEPAGLCGQRLPGGPLSRRSGATARVNRDSSAEYGAYLA